MIKDRIENIYRYTLNEGLEDFKNFLKSSKEIDLTKILSPLRAIPLNYKTGKFNLTKFENHQKHIDIHYIIKGQEKIGLTPVSDLIANMDYDVENDYQLFDGKVNENIILKEGEFLLLFPGEAHVTSGDCGDSSSEVNKIVFKVPLLKV